MSLFPAYSSNEIVAADDHQESFNKVSNRNDTLSLVRSGDQTSTTTKTPYQSYQPDILESWQEKREKPYEILLSSGDDDDGDDSDVQIIEDDDNKSVRAKRKSKKAKKEKKRKDKKDKSEDHEPRSRTISSKHRHHRHHRSPERSSRAKSDKKSQLLSSSAERSNAYLDFVPRRTVFIEDIPNLKPQDAYRIDRRPDTDNLAFSEMYAPQVARYLPRKVMRHAKIITTDTDEDAKLAKKKKKRIKRYFLLVKKMKSNKKAKKLTDNNNYVANNSADAADADEDGGYFLFAPESANNQQPQPEYISLINGDDCDRKKAIETVESNSRRSTSQQIRFQSMIENDQESRSIGPRRSPSQSQLFHQLTSEFNRRLNDLHTPSDARLWIDFIRFQDLRLRHESGDRKFAAEKKFAIVEKALSQHRRSVALNIARLKLLSAYWPELGRTFADVDGEWRRLCFLFPNVPEIWFEFVRFSIRTRSVLSFRAIRRTRKILHQAFKALSGKVLEGDFRSHEIDRRRLERSMIDLISLAARYFDSIDQSEKAISLFQALIEFNLFAPPAFCLETQTFEDWYQSFEKFWDSGLSRIGEFEPIEWRKYQALTEDEKLVAQKDSQNITIFNVDHRIDVAENLILSEVREQVDAQIRGKIWLRFEALRASLHWLPAIAGSPAATSMDSFEDLERVVLSDEDIKPFLFRLRDGENEEEEEEEHEDRNYSKYYLTQSFLDYLGLSAWCSGALDSAPSTSRFEYEVNDYCNDCDRSQDSKIQRQDPKMFEDEYDQFYPPPEYRYLFENIATYERGRRFLFPSETFVLHRFALASSSEIDHFQSLTSSPTSSESSATERDIFINNVMRKLIEFWRTSSVDLRRYRDLILVWIRYKISRISAGLEKAKLIRKFIKDFLREETFRNDLDLWYAYCAFEFAQNRETGRKMFANTIRLMSQSSGEAGVSKSNQKINLNLLRFTLGFVRLLLDLDTITDRFFDQSTAQDPLDRIEILSSPAKLNVTQFLVIGVLGGDDHESDQSPNMITLLRVAKIIDDAIQSKTITADDNDEDYGTLIQAKILLTYLTKDLCETSEMIESYLFALQRAEAFANSSKRLYRKRKNLQRSCYLLHLQLLLRESYALKILRKSIIGGGEIMSKIRSTLEVALAALPHDPLFASMLVIAEIRLANLWFRIRRKFGAHGDGTRNFEQYLLATYYQQNDRFGDSNSRSSDDEECMRTNWIRFMAALHAELLIVDRCAERDVDVTSFDVNSGVQNRIRHLFERALHYRDGGSGDTNEIITKNGNNSNLDDDWLFGKSLADCPTIWRLFLRFEIKCWSATNNNDNCRSSSSSSPAAKAIIYRALQHCPNHKPLYLDAIEHFPEQLQEFADIMIDKQLRVRTTIEEIDMLVKATCGKQQQQQQPNQESVSATTSVDVISD